MLRAETQGVRVAGSEQRCAKAAVGEMAAALRQPGLELVTLHFSPDYDRDELAAAVAAEFGDVPVIGCSTAGELSPDGYRDGSMSGFSLGGDDFRAATVLLDELQNFEFERGAAAARALREQLAARGPAPRGANSFGYLLIDGLSVREEAVASSLYQGLGDIEMFGGSAGDATSFQSTWVLRDGELQTDAAVFALVQTTRPFCVFQTQHFDPSTERMIVTEADVARRVVTEINGNPAAVEFARLVGLESEELTPMIFASHPVVVRIGGKPFVRSIQKANEDLSLTFFCSIDEGIVLTVARGVDMAARLSEELAQVHAQIGQPDLVIGCDCILRKLEMEQKSLTDEVFDVLRGSNVVGFSTYGEQYNGMHVNQTFTGVAIGADES